MLGGAPSNQQLDGTVAEHREGHASLVHPSPNTQLAVLRPLKDQVPAVQGQSAVLKLVSVQSEGTLEEQVVVQVPVFHPVELQVIW